MKRKGILATLLVAVLLLTTACGSAGYRTAKQSMMASAPASLGGYASNEYAGAAGDGGATDAVAPATAERDEAAAVEDSATTMLSASQQRKVIRNASFSLETLDYETTLATIEQEVAQTGSYIQSSSSHGLVESGRARYWMTVRVPVDRYEEFKDFVKTAGNVLASSEGGDDVTAEYFDRDTRVKVLKTQEVRLLELLAKADTVEDMLKIESELSRVRTEIEQLTTQLRRFDDLISYATIDLDITQTAEVTLVENPDGKSFLKQMGETTVNSLKTLLQVLQAAVIALIWVAPYLVIALIIVIALRWLLRRRKKKGVPKQEELPASQTAPTAPVTEEPIAQERKDDPTDGSAE